MPASDGGDDFVGIGDPLEGFGMGVVIVEEAIDRGLKVGHGSEDAAFEAAFGEDWKKPSTALSQEAEVGVKWKVQRGWRAIHCRTVGMLVGGVIVEDGVDGFAGRNLALDRVEETDELLVAMALHVAADHGSVEDVHGGEQGGRSVPLVIMGHRSSTALLHRQPGLGAVERLDLAFFVDGQDHGVRRRIDVETDDVAQLVDEFRVLGELELANAVGLQPMRAPDALDRTDADARGLGHRGARPMCDLARRRFHRERNDALSDLGIEFWNARGTSLIAQKAFEALNREAPLPAPNAVLDLPVSRMIAIVPTPPAVSSTIRARQTCF